MSVRTLVSSGSPYEPKVGISPSGSSRVHRHGRGHCAPRPRRPDGRQGRSCGAGPPLPEIIAVALEGAGASLRHVVRTRILLTRIDDWKSVAEVHAEFFRNIRPVNTIMQVTCFIDPAWLIEIEADAVVDDGTGAA